ncbi:MAG: glycosyltransferase family 39 protein [Candidatus Coatesbacteria bacterium]|nr:glycosyltransferase family 39 protein [Candidatus Coatesbacteria bacterium]
MLESRHFPLVIFLIALCVRVVYVLLFPALPYNIDAAEYVILGQNLADGEGFCYQPGHPTAYRLPFYPLLLALIFSLFGNDAFTAVAILECFIGALTAFAMYYTAALFIKRSRPAAIVALIVALYPPLIKLTFKFMTENVFALLVVLSVFFMYRALTDPPSKAAAVLAGVAIGMSLLTRPTLGPLVVILPVWALLARGQHWGKPKAKLVRVSLIMGIAVLCMVPWIVRNAITMKAFIPFDTHGGATIWYQHNSLSPDGYFWSALPKDKLVEIRNRIEDQRARLDSGEPLEEVMLPTVLKGPMAGFEFLPKEKIAKFTGLTEKERDQAFWRDAIRTILTHPFRYTKKTIKEVIKFWHVFDDNGRFVASYVFLMPFALIGLILALLKGRWSENALYLSPLLCAWLLGATINASYRFRLPFEPLVFTYVGVFCGRFSRFSSRARAVVIIGGSVYAALVFCLFLYPESLREAVQAITNKLGFTAYPVY